MRNKLFFKLFIALLTTSLLVVLAMGGALRWSFDRGFVDYMQEREEQRLNALSNLLLDEYSEHHNWAFLQERRGRWWWRALRSQQASEPHSRSHSGPPPPRTALLSPKGKVLAGDYKKDEALTEHKMYMDGQHIATLVAPVPRPNAAYAIAEQRFLNQQVRATWFIVGLCVLLAALISYLLAKRLLTPIQKLKHATLQLAEGNYAVRVTPYSNDEIGQLGHDFNRMAQTLQANEDLRTALFANVSHELRTPLAILQANIEAMEDGLRPTSRENLQALNHEVVQLNQLINDLYQLSLADAGVFGLHITPQLDLTALLEQCCLNYQERAQAQGLTLQLCTDGHTNIAGDRTRLTQLINNLLENALRYTHAPGRIQVQSRTLEHAVQISIEDSPPGVSADDLPRLFERLFRVDSSRNRDYGGAGLGLALCEYIVHAHHGSIHAEPSALGGLKITVKLPIHHDQANHRSTR